MILARESIEDEDDLIIVVDNDRIVSNYIFVSYKYSSINEFDHFETFMKVANSNNSMLSC